MAVYIQQEEGGKHLCQACFYDNLTNKACVKTSCVGGRDCPLAISEHKPAPEKFALGCSLCRSEKIDQIVTEE